MRLTAETKFSPWLAFAFLLLGVMTGSLIVQTLGYILHVSLTRYSLIIAMGPALWLTYGYCFTATKRHVAIAAGLTLLLAALGGISVFLLDFTPDGMGYQQPSAEAIMNGWNPFGPDAALLWQNIYPSGAWATEAAIASLYGSIETTKMIQIWWVCTALIVFISGLRSHKDFLSAGQMMLAVLMVLGTVVLDQLLTHYVDTMVYLAGVTFIGGLLLYGRSQRGNIVACLIMGACIVFIVNTKLSGIYHAVALCCAALLFIGITTRRFPFAMAIFLVLAGLVAVFIIGYRPYVTSFLKYGIALFPDNQENFSGQQRPSTFDALPSFGRYIYSVFSLDGGAPQQPAQLKWPWTIGPMEWKFSGDPDARTGGFGPLYALGFIISLSLFMYAGIKKLTLDKPLLSLALVCLFSSAFFPQSWWLRYVPFGYAVPFLLLFSIQRQDKIIRGGIIAVTLVFALNSCMALTAACRLFYNNQTHFLEIARAAKKLPESSVYLVPPVPNYEKYNDAYMPLQRRFKEQGVNLPLKIGAACPVMLEMMAEYSICHDEGGR